MNHYPEGHNVGLGMVHDTPDEKEIARLSAKVSQLQRELLDRPMFDYEAVAWALKKVKAFGCHTTEDGAMMTDRLEAILR